VGLKFVGEKQHQGAVLSAKDPGWMIATSSSINTEDAIEKCH